MWKQIRARTIICGVLVAAVAVVALAITTLPDTAYAADNDPITGKPAQQSSVLDYVNSGYQFMAVVGGLLAVMMLIYAGYRYMTSYGDPEKIADAKDIVEKAFIGLALLILAAVILNTVNPRTSQDLCTPGQPGCGTIDFSKPKGK